VRSIQPQDTRARDHPERAVFPDGFPLVWRISGTLANIVSVAPRAEENPHPHPPSREAFEALSFLIAWPENHARQPIKEHTASEGEFLKVVLGELITKSGESGAEGAGGARLVACARLAACARPHRLVQLSPSSASSTPNSCESVLRGNEGLPLKQPTQRLHLLRRPLRQIHYRPLLGLLALPPGRFPEVRRAENRDRLKMVAGVGFEPTTSGL